MCTVNVKIYHLNLPNTCATESRESLLLFLNSHHFLHNTSHQHAPHSTVDTRHRTCATSIHALGHKEAHPPRTHPALSHPNSTHPLLTHPASPAHHPTLLPPLDLDLPKISPPPCPQPCTLSQPHSLELTPTTHPRPQPLPSDCPHTPAQHRSLAAPLSASAPPQLPPSFLTAPSQLPPSSS